MSGSDRQRDVATKSTSRDAVRDLQPQLKHVLDVVRSEVTAPRVALIGPGEAEPGQFYPPQVRQTIRTMLQHGGSSNLQVYYHGDPTRPRADYLATSMDSEASVRVQHADLDLTRPQLTEPGRHDVVIATRLLAPVLQDLQHTGDKAYRQGVVEAWRARGNADSVFLTEQGASSVIQRSHPGLFRSQPSSVSQSGNELYHSVALFGFGAFAGIQADPQASTPAVPRAQTRAPSPLGFRLFRAARTEGVDPRTAAADAAHDEHREEEMRNLFQPRRSGTPTATRGRLAPPPQPEELSEQQKLERRRSYSASVSQRNKPTGR